MTGVTGKPLADRLRPASLDEMAGQAHLIAPGAPFRRSLEAGSAGSFILWGPPGSGKTTLALLVAQYTNERFVRFSAVTGGIPAVRRIIEEAAGLRLSGTGTLLFVDEIHRFNRAQQDAFLPHVEDGTIRLVGATTENPSFEIIAPLLSRCSVHVLKPLAREDLVAILERAAGLGFPDLEADAGALGMIAAAADGDGRRAVNLLEMVVGASGRRVLDAGEVRKLLERAMLRYDKSGEEHYNLISALHKSLRSGDVDAALYWLARMIVSGEDPLYIARRMIRFASEDVGMADPGALTVAMRAADSYRFLGSPEGDLALAEAVCYLATAPRSNSVYVAWGRAVDLAGASGSLPVPMWIRNAPTPLMKELEYGRGYQYAHDSEDGVVTHPHFPAELGEPVLYEPGASGREAQVAERLAWWREMRSRKRHG
jgi:putative ATPase